jgi:phosphatidylserine/phosphatidylglycerophosphate/cardiolipin synthase-like enzyme
MTTDATGSVVDETGTGLTDLVVVLFDASSLSDRAELNRTKTGGTGKFALHYAIDSFFGDEPGKQARQLRLRVMLGQHVLAEVVKTDLTQDTITFDPIRLTKVETTTQWATLRSGSPSRQTDGNAVRWLADDFDAWSRVARVMKSATVLDVMQLDILVDKFHATITDEKPQIVLEFDPDITKPFNAVTPRAMDLADARIERLMLDASKRSVPVRIQIPRWTVDTKGLIVVGTLVMIVLGAIFAPLTLLLIGIIAWSVGAAIVIGNALLAGPLGFKAPQLHQWYADAGTDARNVRVRECILRSTMVTHAKAVIDRGKEGLLLGSPFNQDYFDSLEHRIDDRRRGNDSSKGPIHDVSVGVRGPAVAHIEELFNSHWAIAAPDDVQPTPGTPQAIGAVADDEIVTPAQVVLTLDSMFNEATDGEKGVLESYLRGIHFAQRFIYIENQYFHHDAIVDALIEALKARSDLQLILLVNVSPDMPLYPGWQQKAVRKINDALGTNAKKQVGVFTAWSHSVRDDANKHPRPRLIDNYLHTKSALIDNRWASVGSANLDGASLAHVDYARAALSGEVRNTESNLVVWEEIPATPSPVDALRRRLWSEHLGFADPKDATLLDTPTTNWLDVWNQRAGAKLAQLLADANVVHDAHILPWPDKDFERDCGKHVASGDYLRKLFAQADPALFVKVSNFDLVPAGPTAFPFHY